MLELVAAWQLSFLHNRKTNLGKETDNLPKNSHEVLACVIGSLFYIL